MTRFHKQQNFEEYFFERITKSLQDHKLSVSKDVEYYLLSLLKKFIHSENFFHQTKEGRLENRALALRLYDAVFDEDVQQYQHLKKLGDQALYQAGVFYDGLLNKVVDVGYYITMGQKAYGSLANQKTILKSEKGLRDIFAELCENFAGLVEIVALCCERDELTNLDLLKWIDRYQKTKSEKAKSILVERGICVESLMTEWSEQ